MARIMNQGCYLNLDDAWNTSESLLQLNFQEWGPRLRFIAKKNDVEVFYKLLPEKLSSFCLLGSGDFHHLTPILLRKLEKPFVLVSLDNHPDWDVRPPYWS